jgi:uncharacterized RDD family membrane protein YckC
MEAISKIERKTKPNLGKRISAGFIDYAIILFFQGILFYFYGEQIDGSYVLSGFPFLIVVIFWAIMTIGLEQIIGATIGNYMSDLKPVSIKNFNNERLTIGQSIKRHLADIIDLWLFGLIGILLIKNTKNNQRLGDLWAKTIVVDTNDSDQGLK